MSNVLRVCDVHVSGLPMVMWVVGVLLERKAALYIHLSPTQPQAIH